MLTNCESNDEERQGSDQTGGPEEMLVAIRLPQPAPQQPERDERADHRAQSVEPALDPEREPHLPRAGGTRDQGVARRVLQTLSHTIPEPASERRPSSVHETEPEPRQG
jgi:hypothetical protein